MHPRTFATLAELEVVSWFSQVGVKDTNAAKVLSSWQEAVASCESDSWSDLQLEAANQYRERLAERSLERFREWNAIVVEIKAVTEPFVRDKIAAVGRQNQLPKAFEDSVQWDVLHLCMEAEYADVYPPGFFAAQAYWYTKGHFPCGWEGDFPKGTRIIY